MKTTLLVSIVSTSLLFALCAQADPASEDGGGKGQKMMGKMKDRFDAADTNHDGQLTLAEAQSKMPKVAKNFDQIDTDKKGYVTMDQIKSFAMEKMQERKSSKTPSN